MTIGVLVLVIVEIDDRVIPPLYCLPDPGKVALIATTFEHTESVTHADLVRAFSDATQRGVLLHALPTQAPQSVLSATRDRYRKALGGHSFPIETVGMFPPVSFGSPPIFSPNMVRVSVALPVVAP